METLSITTPFTEGDTVRHAQELLAKNKYGKFYKGKIQAVVDRRSRPRLALS